jgi:transposase
MGLKLRAMPCRTAFYSQDKQKSVEVAAIFTLLGIEQLEKLEQNSSNSSLQAKRKSVEETGCETSKMELQEENKQFLE